MSYWKRQSVNRRSFLKGGIGVTAGVAGMALLGCGEDEATPAPTGTAAGSPGASTSTPGVVATATVDPNVPQPGGTLRLSRNADTDTLDMLSSPSQPASIATSYVYSRLFSYTLGDRQAAPGGVDGDLVEEWEQPDDLTFIFHLRQNAKWDERAPTSSRQLSSEDVVQSWQKFAEVSSYRADLVNSVSDTAAVTSVEALDDSTVQMNLAFPDATVLPVLAWGLNFMVHPIESMNGGFDPATETRGTGPYVIESYQPGIGFEYARNPNYYGAPDLPYADTISVPIIPEAAQAEAQFRAKQIHVNGVPTQNIPITVSEVPGTSVYFQAPSAGTSCFAMHRVPGSVFDDHRVRQAVSMSMDRDAFLDVIDDPAQFEDMGVELNRYWNTPLGPGYGAYWLDPKGSEFGDSGKYLHHNVTEARVARRRGVLGLEPAGVRHHLPGDALRP